MGQKSIETRERIELQTVRLLNERGLSNVTMRDVSQALGISIGNLTYHYHKWDDLVDAIFARMQAELDELHYNFPDKLVRVVEYIGRVYDVQMHYAFIFSNYHIFFEVYPRYNGDRDRFLRDRMSTMRDVIDKLVAARKFCKPGVEHNYDILVRNTWIILSGWYGFTKMLDNDSYPDTKERFFLSLWSLYVHHLTDRGKRTILRAYREYKQSGFTRPLKA